MFVYTRLSIEGVGIDLPFEYLTKGDYMNFTHKDPIEAFFQAVGEHRLSIDPSVNTYAGNYMYMGTWSNGGPVKDQFKHIDTRKYLE